MPCRTPLLCSSKVSIFHCTFIEQDLIHFISTTSYLQVNPQTWVVLLDFFGIGTSPKKTYRLDAETEETFSWDKRMDVRSFYENQPDDFINSEIAFTVRSFSLTFNKPEYQLMKASVEGLQSNVQIRGAKKLPEQMSTAYIFPLEYIVYIDHYHIIIAQCL